MRRSPLYSRFVARRAKWVYVQVKDLKGNPPTATARDCSGASVGAYFRAWSSPPGATSSSYLVNQSMTKTLNPDGSDGSVTAGSTGWFRVLVEFPSDDGQVVCEVVVVDTSVARTSGAVTTPSGYLEEQIEDQWTATVAPSTTRS